MTATREATQTTSREAIVGANVRRLRDAAGISQAELASLITKSGHDFGEMAVWSIENGRRRVRIDDLFTLGHALGVEATSLLRPGAGSGALFEIVFQGAVTEQVTADEYEIDDQWIRFQRQGRPVYLAAVGRVLGVRILTDGGEPGGE